LGECIRTSDKTDINNSKYDLVLSYLEKKAGPALLKLFLNQLWFTAPLHLSTFATTVDEL
jgi:hypothetical protein